MEPTRQSMTRSLVLAGILGVFASTALGPGGASGALGQTTFSEGYRLVDTWTSREPASSVPRLANPLGVDVSPDSVVYVADRGAGAILQLNGSGLLTARWPAQPGTGDLLDVAASIERVFVVGRDRLEVRTANGDVVTELAMPGATGVAVGADGRAYVARRTGFDLQASTVIEVLDRDGRGLDTWSASPFIIVSPRGLAIGPDGRLFLAADGAVYIFEGGRVTGGLRLPDGIEGGEVFDVDADELGRLYATQGATARRLVVWDVATGQAVGTQTLAGATCLAVGPGTGLTVSTNVANGFVGLSHIVDRSDLASPPVRWGESDDTLGKVIGPRRVAVSAAGSVYILDSAHRVQRWSATGQPLEQWPASSGEYIVDVIGGADLPCTAGPRTIRCMTAVGSVAWSSTPSAEGWFAAADGDADVLASADLAEQRVWLTDRGGAPVGGWSLSAAGGFTVASDVAVDGGTAYVVDRDAEAVRVVDLTGASTGAGTISVANGAVRVAARDGLLYALTDDGWIWKYRPDGQAVTAWRPAPDGRPEDLAVGPNGRVYVAEPALHRVLVFEPGAVTPAVPPPPEVARCAVAVDKLAAPAEVLVGDAVDVKLSVRGSCPEGDGRVDIMLIVDQSGSMAGTPLSSAQAAAVAFLGYLTPGRAQVGLVGFSTAATVLQPLTDELRSVVKAIGRLSPGGQTVYSDALESALGELVGSRGRGDVPQIVVMLSDGKPTDRTQVLRAAEELKAVGISIYTIGLGSDVDAALLAAIASEPAQYHDAPTESDLADVYASIARQITAGQLLVRGTVVDTLPPGVSYVYGSARPAAAVSGKTLSWDLVDVPTTGIALFYQVRPWRVGLQPTNASAILDYVDGEGQPGQLPFPVPQINVLPRSVWQAFLPQVWKRTCKPQRADVVLVFDTSSSMTGPAAAGSSQTKLEAAMEAGRTFLNAMQFPDDQAAIVSFDSEGRRVQSLTGSRAELELALATVTANRGTRIDRGLELALLELLGSRHRERNNPVIVLLSDGLPETGTERRAMEMAMDARAAGISLYTIGLGEDADADLLWLLAGDSSRTFEAPDASQLRTIYSQIAGRVLCY